MWKNMTRRWLLPVLLGIFSVPCWPQEAALAPLYQAPMQWTDDQGKPVRLSQWQGKPVLITMAYSTCRKFCPITLARLAEVQRLFDQHKIDAEFVVISYDPQGDTWQTWAEFRKSRHYERSNWHFLVGSEENTKTVSQLLGMDYWLYDEHIMHNFKIVRLSPTGAVEKGLGWESQEQIETLLPE